MADKRLAGTKILMVIAPDQFRDEELLIPKKSFQDEGAEVLVAARSTEEAHGMLGARFKPDLCIKDVKSSQFQAMVIVGGMGSPSFLWEDQNLHRLIQEMDRDKKVVAAICLSGAVLAKAGVLRDREATVWSAPTALQALREGKCRYRNQHVVQDGHIITADGPEAASNFAMSVVNQLASVASKT